MVCVCVCEGSKEIKLPPGPLYARLCIAFDPFSFFFLNKKTVGEREMGWLVLSG